MKCKLCETRKARRHCPAIEGDICTVCCGNQREVTIDCPIGCSFLIEARLHEKRLPWDPETDPNKDVPLTEEFLTKHKEELVFLGFTLFKAAGVEHVVDRDLREALDSLAQTYRTQANGLFYESRPVNPFANRIYGTMQEAIEELQEDLKKGGRSPLRDAEILGVLAFYGRVLRSFDNGRPKGRAYIFELIKEFAAVAAGIREEAPPAPSLIL